jgi:hypothetical protein
MIAVSLLRKREYWRYLVRFESAQAGAKVVRGGLVKVIGILSRVAVVLLTEPRLVREVGPHSRPLERHEFERTVEYYR